MVSLNFGQIRDFPSRGFFEDNEEEDEGLSINAVKSFSFKSTQTAVAKKDTVKVLLVTNTKVSHAYVQVYLKHKSEKTGTIFEEESGKVVADVFMLDKGVVHVKQMELLDMDESNAYAKTVLDLAAGSEAKVVLLTSESLVSFKSEDLSEEAINMTSLPRHLKSSTWTDKVNCHVMEQPNTLSGCPAALLTLCQFEKRPCLLLVNYTDSENVDSDTLSGFSSCLASHGHFDQVSPEESKKRLKVIHEEGLSSKGHIYI